jgi:sugar O-acyltransferase (sialic acid O-acetyltransferase NeuD family)
MVCMRIVIIGGGGHGRVVIDIVERMPALALAGILDDGLPLGETVLGHAVLGKPADLPRLIRDRDVDGAVVAVGDNWTRSQVVASIRSMTPSLAFPNVIHPAAQVGKHVRLGQGNVLMAGAVVNCNATVGDFCVLNTNCSVDHDSVLGNFVSFAPNSCAGGGAEVGDFSAVCLGANVIDRVKIGPQTVVGAGATVLHDMPANALVYGTPARKVRDRNPGDRYL